VPFRNRIESGAALINGNSAGRIFGPGTMIGLLRARWQAISAFFEAKLAGFT